MKIGLVYAMSEEIRSILEKYELGEPVVKMGMSFYEIADNIVAVAGGIGKANIAAATALMCELYDVDIVINSGLAGGFGDHAVGSIVLVDRCVQHDFDTSVVGDEPGLVATVNVKDFYTDYVDESAEVLKANDIDFVKGAVATGDWFATSGERANIISERFSPVVADMEAGAIAQICLRAGVKFISVKGISDRLECSAEQKDSFYKALDDIIVELNKVAAILVAHYADK
ncbi:MAG: 5'-methylthioadenosine/S-adenosylhomocysteine nucleosidase [Firmicutes bacterium]|nr:5'-methylthioadenosine/S-adenosylhomocysteine nucleosidase [Bacillota bacterium]